MIKNELERQVTSARIEGFDRAICDFDPSPDAHPGVDPRLIPLLLEGMQSQRETLVAELADYDAVQAGETRARELMAITPIFDLGRALVRAQLASGLDEQALADEVGVTRAEIERYEKCDYESASLAQLVEVAEVLRFALGDTSISPDTGPVLAPEPAAVPDRARPDRLERTRKAPPFTAPADEGGLGRKPRAEKVRGGSSTVSSRRSRRPRP